MIILMPPYMQVRILWEASDALCAGDVNFVASSDRAGLPTWASTKPTSEPPAFREWPRMHDSEYQGLPVAGKVIDHILRHKAANSADAVLNVCLNGTETCRNTDPNKPLPGCCSALRHEVLAYKVRTATVNGGAFSVSASHAMTSEEWIQRNNPQVFSAYCRIQMFLV